MYAFHGMVKNNHPFISVSLRDKPFVAKKLILNDI